MDSSSSSNVTIDDVVIDHEVLYEAIRKSFTRDPFDHYVNGICGLFICLVGTISNALSFSVLIRRTMRLSTYVYLAGLCLSDFTACLFLIPGYILDAYPMDKLDFELPRTYTYTKLLSITGAISTTARALSVWLCVAFTIDRWIMICRPFVGPLYCTMKNARRVTLIIYIIGIFYAIPLMFEYEPHEQSALADILIDQNTRIYRLKLSNLGKNSIFRWTYVLINALGVYIIPLILIGILNRKLLMSIRSLERRSAEYNAPLPTKQGVTIMLLATTLMLLVFRSPSATISVMWLISAKMFIHEKPPFPLRKFHSIANLCATFNAATTFILFIIYGTKFRSEFTRIYCGFFHKIKRTKSKRTTITEQDQHQQEQMKHLLSNNNKMKNNNQVNLNDTKPKLSLTNQTNGNGCVELLKDKSSLGTSTTTASGVSFSPKKHIIDQQKRQRLSYDQEYELMKEHNKNIRNSNNKNNLRQVQMTIREDECMDNHTDTKAGLLTESYFDWLKNLISCHR